MNLPGGSYVPLRLNHGRKAASLHICGGTLCFVSTHVSRFLLPWFLNCPPRCGCIRAQSFAERLRLGLAVIHGEAQDAESDQVDGRHSPPTVKTTGAIHPSMEIPRNARRRHHKSCNRRVTEQAFDSLFLGGWGFISSVDPQREAAHHRGRRRRRTHRHHSGEATRFCFGYETLRKETQ